MRSKITVIGDVEVQTDIADVVGENAIAGSGVVGIGPGADVAAAARLAASRASGAAIVLVAPASVETALRASLLPRGRVIAVEPDGVRAAAEAVLTDSCATLTV